MALSKGKMAKKTALPKVTKKKAAKPATKATAVLAGKTLVVTGTLSKGRTVIEATLKKAGARVTGSVSANTHYLIAGADAGSKLGTALSLGVPVLTEAEMNELLAGNEKQIQARIEKKRAIDGLQTRARELEIERERIAALESARPQVVRAPVRARPANPVRWYYSFWFDDALSPEAVAELTKFFERFTTVADERGGFFVAGPQTEPERRRAAWAMGSTVLEIEQLRAQLPTADAAARTAQLERALARPSGDGWFEAVMLLSTWDEATLPEAIRIAERALARWPDELRSGIEAWKDRPALKALTRLSWGKIGPALQYPDFSHLTFLKTQDVAGLRANQTRLTQITALDLSGSGGLGDLVLECTALTNLRHLALQQPTHASGTAPLALAKLLAAPHLQKLEALSLYGYTLSTEDVGRLAACAQPLRFLRIQHAKMSAACGAALAKLASAKRLVTLDLKFNDLGPEGAQALFANPEDWAALRALDISANEIGDRGVVALAGAKLTELRWLNLSSNVLKELLTPASAKLLASAPSLGKLETLLIGGHPIGAEGLAALLESPNLNSLRGLEAGYPSADLASIATACGKGNPVPILELSVGHLDGSKTTVDLAKATFLKTVRLLNVDAINGKDYAPLLACPHLANLEVLSFSGCYQFAEAGFAALIGCSPPPKLRYLNLPGWKLTAAQAKALAESPLGQQLWGLSLQASYIPPEAWRFFYDAGLSLVDHAVFDCHGPSEHTAATTFREET